MEREIAVNELADILENYFGSGVVIESVTVNTPSTSQRDTTNFKIGVGHACTLTVNLSGSGGDDSLTPIEKIEHIEDFILDRVKDLEECGDYEENVFDEFVLIRHKHIEDEVYFPLDLAIDTKKAFVKNTKGVCNEVKEFFEDLKNNKR